MFEEEFILTAINAVKTRRIQNKGVNRMIVQKLGNLEKSTGVDMRKDIESVQENDLLEDQAAQRVIEALHAMRK